jgi:hypothetical protein
MSSRRTTAKRAPRSVASEAPPAAGEASAVSAALGEQAAALAASLDRELANGRMLAPEAVQAIMAAACKAYSMQIEAGASFPPLPARTAVNATDVMVTTSALLKAVDLQLFELGMWRSWTGR